MKAEHINPFLNAITHTFSTRLNAESRRGEPLLGDPKRRAYPISALIPLAGDARGMVVINFSAEVAMEAASATLIGQINEIDSQVLDVVSELANEIASTAKDNLKDCFLTVGVPEVVIGEGYEIDFPSVTPPLVIPFETDLGPLRLEAGLEPAHELAV